MFASPGEIAFKFFNYSVYWYGIIMALAIIAGLSVVSFIRRRFHPEISKDFILDLSFYIVIGGIIGARIYYVLADIDYYSKFPAEIFALWHGGLSIHGAIIGGVITGAIFTKSKNESFLKVADICTFGLVTGQIIGRWGNFFNSEAFGLPTSLPWKLFIPLTKRPIEFYNMEYFHPTFLYESILNIIILVILTILLAKFTKIKAGTIFFSYFILYALARFTTESIRIDSILNIYGLPIAKLASIIFCIIGLSGLILIYKRK